MPTFIELCAGAGGLSTGLTLAGWECLLLNDNNKDCCATLEKNHPGTKIKCCSMEELKLEKYSGKVDLLASGCPCQSFSHSGQRRGFDDPRGNLLLVFIQMVNKLRPKIFLIENVKGLTTHNGGESFKFVLEQLALDGLYTVSYKILNASHYDVPQKRERVFIVGSLISTPFTFPTPKTTNPVLKEVLTNVPDSPCAKYSELKLKMYKYIPQGGCWINLPEKLQKSYLGNSFNSGGGKRGILYRLSMEKPSLTLLCSPSQKQTERCHPLEDRPLSVREYARIQTFPDDYEFLGSMSSQYKQIGNAVPVKLAKSMGKALFKHLVNL